MRSMWPRIGLGAVGVFVVGMLLLTGFRHSRDVVTNAVTSSFAPALQAAASYAGHHKTDLPFRLDGNRLGTVTSMQLERTGHDQTMTVRLVVRLDDATDPSSLDDCDLLPTNDTDLDFEHGFRCGTGTEGRRAEIGEVRFEPVGFTRPILVHQAQVAKLSEGDPFKANVDLSHGVQLDAKGRDQASVRVRADSSGAVMRVRGRNGGDLVRISADSNQAFIQIRDENGKVLFRLQAGDSGVELRAEQPVENP